MAKTGTTLLDLTPSRDDAGTSIRWPILDPDAPCGWCESTDRPRIQRGPAPEGWQCVDADACNAEWRRQRGR